MLLLEFCNSYSQTNNKVPWTSTRVWAHILESAVPDSKRGVKLIQWASALTTKKCALALHAHIGGSYHPKRNDDDGDK